MLCYISKNYRHLGKASDKAKTDTEAILDSMGFVNVGLAQSRSTNPVVAYLRTLLSVRRGVRRLGPGDTILVLYPLKKYYDYVVEQAHRRGARVITLVIDPGSFRRHKLTTDEEVERFNRSDATILATRSLVDWFRDHGVTTPLLDMDLWDFLSDAVPATLPDDYRPGRRVIVIGGLSTRTGNWIEQLAADSPDLEIVGYGGHYDGADRLPNIRTYGPTDPDEIIARADGDYGLVWYGNSIDTVDGPIGEYLPYAIPHKTSLFLRAGKPVIVWKNCALADRITRLGVGIAVDNLRDLAARLDALSPESYREMARRAADYGASLAAGTSVRTAVSAALAALPEI